jgi:hypothetical protein
LVHWAGEVRLVRYALGQLHRRDFPADHRPLGLGGQAFLLRQQLDFFALIQLLE